MQRCRTKGRSARVGGGCRAKRERSHQWGALDSMSQDVVDGGIRAKRLGRHRLQKDRPRQAGQAEAGGAGGTGRDKWPEAVGSWREMVSRDRDKQQPRTCQATLRLQKDGPRRRSASGDRQKGRQKDRRPRRQCSQLWQAEAEVQVEQVVGVVKLAV